MGRDGDFVVISMCTDPDHGCRAAGTDRTAAAWELALESCLLLALQADRL